MIQNGLIVISLLASVLGLFRPVTLFDDAPLNLGAISYPTSLDAFENPGASQQVSQVVTHSTQHSNANDALEALQAKLRIDGDTTGGFLLGSDGTRSTWTSWATTTRITASGLGTFGGLISTASSTIIGNLNITGNSTTTNATTTNFYTTTASSTNTFGAGLSSCSGTNFVQWSAGKFSCGATSSSGGVYFATSTATSTFASDISLATTTSVTVGQKVVIWATHTGRAGNSTSCNEEQVGLMVKPASTATTTIAIARCDTNSANSWVSLPMSGMYVAGATEDIEIYIGLVQFNGVKAQSGFASIIYTVSN